MSLCDLIVDAVCRAVGKADAPVGVCLSGGIDSSTVATLAPGLPLFTGFYDDAWCDERNYARHVGADRDWHQVLITPDDFVRVFDDVAAALGDLRCGPGAVGQYVVAEHAAGHGIRTLLTGEGGDELFGGYARQYHVAGLPLPDGYDRVELPHGYPRSLRGALDREWNDLRNLCRVDEVIAGAHGIRVVPPLLDPWVVAHVHQLPANQRIGKTLIRDAMRGFVPDAILDRTDKRGFPVPYVAWAQEEPVRSFVRDRIGYTPDPAEPWSRRWWYDLLDATRVAVAA